MADDASTQPLPPLDTTEAQHILLALLVHRLGGSVTVTEAELHAVRDNLTLLAAHRNPTAFEWVIEARVNEPNPWADHPPIPQDVIDRWQPEVERQLQPIPKFEG